MSARLEKMIEDVRDKAHAGKRTDFVVDVATECDQESLSWMQRSARLLQRQCEAETVVIGEDERIVFTRTLPQVPLVYSKADWGEKFSAGRAHELGPISNICGDWGMVLTQGIAGRRWVAQVARSQAAEGSESAEFLDAVIACLDAVSALASRYCEKAKELGRADLAAVLERVPEQAPQTLWEALQSLRFLHSMLWLCGHYHVGLGRFDQYMYPYLRGDLEAGRLTLVEAEELVAEFFVCLNKDSDLYPGVQQGDNGQSLMLGGVDRNGECAVNEMTYLVLRVARDVNMIDPKINLRIDSKTDPALLELATELTRKGLGFPQYSNDDVVIPGLVAHGYSLEDARDYTVAACWEYIIPGKGMDVVNIGAVSFPYAVNAAVVSGLEAGDDFPGILQRIRDNIFAQTKERVEAYDNLIFPPAPYYSALMDNCLEKGRDLSQGNTYNNFGIHGACSANAADSLAAVQCFVFDEKSVDPKDLVAALAADWKGYEALKAKMASGPKTGNNNDRVDKLLSWLFNCFADACEAIPDNGRGGIVRPGSGSAMYYVWLARGHEGMGEPMVGATSDGRSAGDFFSSSLAPAPGTKSQGPTAIMQTYGKLDYQRICNGGPITLELDDAVFQTQDGIAKVAMLVSSFARLGCQQLQINTLNVETLQLAKKKPEKYRNLIVRVWGWSGYFCELGPEYQDHVIARHMHRF